MKNYVQFLNAQTARAALAMSEDIDFKCALCGNIHNFAWLKNCNNYGDELKNKGKDPDYCLTLVGWKVNSLMYSVYEDIRKYITLKPEEFEKNLKEFIKDENKLYEIFKMIKKLHEYRGNPYPYSIEIPEEKYYNFNTLEEAEKAPLNTKFKCALCGDLHMPYDYFSYANCINLSKISKRYADLRHLMLTPEAFINIYIGTRPVRIYRSINSLYHWNNSKLPTVYKQKLKEKGIRIHE
jgi:hypothetical protein